MMINDIASWATPLEQICRLSRVMEEKQLTVLDVAGPEFTYGPQLRDVAGGCPVHADFVRVLVCLRDFELAIRAALSPRCQVYLLGVENIRRLSPDTFRGVEPKKLSALCSTLYSFGLIYRFPCAVKFQYPPADVAQLRVSGWGVAACSCLPEPVPEEETRQRQLCLEQTFRAHAAEYGKLISACDSSRRPLETDLIHRLNEFVPLPVVT
jgi:hypothetical protein